MANHPTPAARPQVGEQELDLLRYVSDHAPVTLREVIDGYGAPRDLARTTVLTMMDRLRRKGFLERSKRSGERGPDPGPGPAPAHGRKQGGVYVYAPAQTKSSLMSTIVRSFVDRTLGGSLTPLVAYLVDAKGLTDDEARKLRELIEE